MSSKEDISKLERWLKRQPHNATVLRCSARSLGQIITVRELVAETECSDYNGLAKGLYEDCEDWADSKEKDTRFLIEWLAEDRPIATKELVMSPLNSDGTNILEHGLEGLIAAQAATGLQKDEMLIKMTKAMVEIVIRVSESIQAGIAVSHSREQENFKLREALLDAAAGDDEFKKEVLGFVKAFLPAVLPKSPPHQGT
jgi:hypothetical protein